MIKRSITSAALLAGLLCSASALAGTTTPVCNHNAFNMVVVNKNVVSNDCWDGGVKGTFCFASPSDVVPSGTSACSDIERAYLQTPDNISIGEKSAENAELHLEVWYKSVDIGALKFKYASGRPSVNCDLLKGKVNCAISTTNTNGHKTYTLVLSQAFNQ